MPLSGLQYSLRWRARGKHGVFEALSSDSDTGYRIWRVSHLIVLRPVAGFPAVLLFFVSSCFLHQNRDFQHLSASSLYQSRPSRNPLFLVVDVVVRSTQKVSCLSVWTCVLCCMFVYVCVFVCQEVPLLKESLSYLGFRNPTVLLLCLFVNINVHIF